jgi:uncharacterized protein
MTPLPEHRVAARLGLNPRSVAATIELLNGGATVPFIARYRKEATASADRGPLDEVQIGQIKDTYQKLLDFDKRREAILKSIAEQDKLTPELRRKIDDTTSLTDLEDLYLPYKQKRKTRATMAIERGLEPLANVLIAQREASIERIAQRYLSDTVPTMTDALQGARDILAERISEDADARQRIRSLFEREATVRSTVKKGKEDKGAKFKDYFDFEEPLKRVPSHRLLALRRGEAEGFLSVSISPGEEAAIERLERQFIAERSGTAVCKGMATNACSNPRLKPNLPSTQRQKPMPMLSRFLPITCNSYYSARPSVSSGSWPLTLASEQVAKRFAWMHRATYQSIRCCIWRNPTRSGSRHPKR